MQFYDMHSHILPNIDDGANSVEASVKMLESLKKQGVTNVCLTPHFYSNHESAEDFIKSRDEAIAELKPHIPDGMKVVVGAEVYVTRFLLSNDDLSGVTYGKSNYMLTEHGYTAHFEERSLNYFYKLMEKGFTPVLPHVERYEVLMSNPSIIEELKDMGVIIQTNALNYIKGAPFLRKRKLIKFINEGLIDIIGTDAHSFSHNSPEAYAQAIEYITAKCGEDTVAEMMQKSEEIFNSAL
ncbi:MAG: CpsB/CapC family capsule biosynthesis tyrosine phosphatase [Ruminococcus sp.]|nr:CpsB/CapC family capsule biosynthesis tyrosine phosphatase [Ruminococcus sp.]